MAQGDAIAGIVSSNVIGIGSFSIIPPAGQVWLITLFRVGYGSNVSSTNKTNFQNSILISGMPIFTFADNSNIRIFMSSDNPLTFTFNSTGSALQEWIAYNGVQFK